MWRRGGVEVSLLDLQLGHWFGAKLVSSLSCCLCPALEYEEQCLIKAREFLDLITETRAVSVLNSFKNCSRSVSFLQSRRCKFPFRKRSLPFETVDAISHNGRRHLKRSMPFLMTVDAIVKVDAKKEPIFPTLSDDMRDNQSNA